MFYNCFLDKRADLRKCDPLGAAITGVGSIIGGMINRSTQNDTNKMNLKIARENNDAQERIAAANNQTQIDMMRENNDWSANQAELAFNREAEYNSAQAQVARYRDAGLNPAVMMQNSGATSASASAPSAAGSTIHPSMPNFVTPTMQNPPSVMLDAVNALSQLSASYATYKQAQKTGKEVDWFDQQMETTLKNIMSETNYNQIKANHEQFLTVVDGLTLVPMKKKELLKLDQEIITLASQGELAKAQKKIAEAEERIKKILGDREEQSTPILLDNLRKQGRVLDSQVELNKASTENQKSQSADARSHVAVNEAEADYKKALSAFTKEQTSQLEDMHTDNVILKRMLARKMGLDSEFAAQTLNVRVQMLKNANAISEKEAEKLEQDIKLATKANNMYYINWIYDRIDNTMRDVGYVLPFGSTPVGVEKSSYGPSYSSPNSSY